LSGDDSYRRIVKQLRAIVDELTNRRTGITEEIDDIFGRHVVVDVGLVRTVILNENLIVAQVYSALGDCGGLDIANREKHGVNVIECECSREDYRNSRRS